MGSLCGDSIHKSARKPLLLECGDEYIGGCMSNEKYKKHAKDLSEDAGEMITQILERYTCAILEELHSQLKERDEKIKNMKQALGTTISWLDREFGKESVAKLLDILHGIDK
jgi:hypothetical protein